VKTRAIPSKIRRPAAEDKAVRPMCDGVTAGTLPRGNDDEEAVT
jgi:hypothetical protein